MNNSKQKSNRGFTLAEVLVTLAIIGVVAALTIPSLISKVQNQQYRTAFKENYASIARATVSLAEDKGGSLKGIFGQENPIYPADAMMDDYGQYLNFIKKSGWNYVNTCWQVSSLKFLDGTSYDITGFAKACATLNNGALLTFIGGDPICSGVTSCGDIQVDVNGPKQPNTWGKDIFGIRVHENTISAYGINDDIPWTSHCTSTSLGLGCAGAVLLGKDY